MASFDNVAHKLDNFKGYQGDPPTTEEEYDELDCWKDKSQAPSWASISVDVALEDVRRNRRREYPEWNIQLEKIYDDGIDKWKTEMIDLVKAKWPKDGSGPIE